MSEKDSSYRSIFKATSLFGGVQAYQILINIVKQKFIAVLLGPLGVGINGLYTSATQLIQEISGLGLSSSAIRNVSEAYGTGDQNRVNRVVTVLRKLVWVTGLLGMLAVIVLSPVLSQTSFGDNKHIIPFILISVTLLLTQLSAGQKVVLQGTRKLKYLAKSTALGVTIGLFVSVPLYYFFGTDGIVPNIIISSCTALLLTWYFSRKVSVEKVKMTGGEVLKEGRSMLTMGVAMCLTHVLASAISYVLRWYIRANGSIDDVGLFTSGYQLMNQYTGLIFTAMITDFYPRLAAVNTDNVKCKELVNKQAEVGMLILVPMLCACIVFVPIVVRILFSEAFLPISDYIVWASVGISFKMSSFAIGYILLAKAESRLFLITETVSNIVTLCLNILGYHLGGLAGLGIASAAGFLFYLIMMYLIAYRRYDFSYTKTFFKLFIVQLLLVCMCILCHFILTGWIMYSFGSIFVLLSLGYAYKGLDERINISELIKDKLSRR